VPEELKPDFSLPIHPGSPGTKMQIARFRNKVVEISKVSHFAILETKHSYTAN
jgi:hypothetical protein